jgi:hypothetical protein
MTRVGLYVQEGRTAIVTPARQQCPAGIKEHPRPWPRAVSVIVHRRPRLSMELAKAFNGVLSSSDIIGRE